MRRALIAALAALLSACSNPAPPAATTAPAAAPAAAKPIDASAIPERIRVLAVPGGHAAQTAAALEQWINERIAPKKASVMVIDTPEDALVRDLMAGKGEIAADLLLSFERDDQVAFATPLATDIREVVVTSASHPLVSLEDVAGRRIVVRKSSDHFASLTRLNDQLVKINRRSAKIAVADEKLTDEELIKQVAAGTVPATLAYDNEFRACCAGLAGVNVNADISVSQGGSRSWVTRKDAPRLLAVLNDFFSTHRQAF